MERLTMLYRDVDRTPYLFMMRRIAKQQGLDLVIERWGATPSAGPTGQEWGELLLDQSVDLIGENYWGLQSYRALGHPVIAIGSVVNDWTEKLMVQPGITSLEQLRGTKFALRSTGPQALLPKLWLHDIGMENDITTITYPESETGRWGHWKKVADGECQVCFMTNICSDVPLAAGLVELPHTPYAFAGANVTLTAVQATLDAKHEAVQTLVNASFDTTRTFKTDLDAVLTVMKEDCLDLMAEHFPDIYEDEKMRFMAKTLATELSDYPIPTPEGISNARRIRLGTAPELDNYNPMIMWDLSFARTALARGGATAK